MRILSLNCRGLGNPRSIRELHSLVKMEGPQALFLMETCLNRRKLERLRIQLGYSSCLGVDRVGRGGGLALLWSDDVRISINNYSRFYIDGDISDGAGVSWSFTGFYGDPVTTNRVRSWQLLRCLHSQRSNPWLVMGDFNEIVDQSEKLGLIDCIESQMQLFCSALADCSLLDIGFQDWPYTWSNRRDGDAETWVRLDRGVCSKDWLDLHPNARIKHISVATSDHLGLAMDTLGSSQGTPKPQRRFRFEQAWTKDPSCEEIITEAWATNYEGSRMFNVCQKIKACRLKLLNWSRTRGQRRAKSIHDNQLLLQQYEENLNTDQNRAKASQLRIELNSQLEEDESYWNQRSRISWLKEGDSNTKFFHVYANHRRRTNEILMLWDSHGVLITGESGLEQVITNYFGNMLTSSNPSSIDLVVNSVDQVVTPEMNDILLQPVTEDEVKIALFQIPPSKAPGPDGMTALFFQKYWHVLSADITYAVLNCISFRKILKSVNFTHIALIPKVANLESMGQFRPISLCNVLYKLVSKVLANKLKRVLPQIISDSQSAFFPGHMITDNVLLAFEALHYMKNKKGSGLTHLATKLDISKVYDRVEWSYLQAIMLKLGFESQLVDLIMECLSTVSY
jgi:hypothetical protein